MCECQPVFVLYHSPHLTNTSALTILLATANIKAHANSAVDSVRTPGVLVTYIPSLVAHSISILSKPTAYCAIILSLLAYRSKLQSTLSLNNDIKASISLTFSKRTSYGGGQYLSHTSTS